MLFMIIMVIFTALQTRCDRKSLIWFILLYPRGEDGNVHSGRRFRHAFATRHSGILLLYNIENALSNLAVVCVLVCRTADE